MAVYLLASEVHADALDAIEPKLKPLVPELARIRTIEQISPEIARGDNGKVVVIFYSPAISPEIIDNLINIADRYKDRVFFILLSNDISTSDYKRLVRSGGADWVAAGGNLLEVPDLIGRLRSAPEKQPETATVRKASIISLLPVLGGVGNTTLGIEVALELKRSKRGRGLKICYLDLDFQTSHAGDLLDTDARLQIEEILEHPERLDDELFELFVNHHVSGIDLLAAPKSKIDLCEVGLATLDILLEKVSKHYDVIFLDHPVQWLNWTGPILANSGLIVLTAMNTVPCLRQLRATVDTVSGIKSSAAKVAIVINRAEEGLFGHIKNRKHIDVVVPNQQVLYVREDTQAVERANQGKPIALGGASRAPKDFKALAELCESFHFAAPPGVGAARGAD